MVLTGINRKILDAVSPQLCSCAHPFDLLPRLTSVFGSSEVARAEIERNTERNGASFGMMALLSGYQRLAENLEPLKEALLYNDINIDLTEQVLEKEGRRAMHNDAESTPSVSGAASSTAESDEIHDLRQQVSDTRTSISFLRQQNLDSQRENKAANVYIMEKQSALEQKICELTKGATSSNSDTKAMLEQINKNFMDFFSEQRSITAEANARLSEDIAHSEAALEKEAKSRPIGDLAADIFGDRKVHGLIVHAEDPTSLAYNLPEECLPSADKAAVITAVRETKLARLGSAVASGRLIDGIKRSLIGREDKDVHTQLNTIVDAWEPVASAKLITALKEAIRRLFE